MTQLYMGDNRSNDQIGSLFASTNDLYIGKLAELYVQEIVRLHKVPVSIESNRDNRFTLAF